MNSFFLEEITFFSLVVLPIYKWYTRGLKIYTLLTCGTSHLTCGRSHLLPLHLPR